MNSDIQVITTSQDVGAQVTGGVGLVDRLLYPTGGTGVLPPDVNESVIDLAGVGGDDHALQHLVGIAFH